MSPITEYFVGLESAVPFLVAGVIFTLVYFPLTALEGGAGESAPSSASWSVGASRQGMRRAEVDLDHRIMGGVVADCQAEVDAWREPFAEALASDMNAAHRMSIEVCAAVRRLEDAKLELALYGSGGGYRPGRRNGV